MATIVREGRQRWWEPLAANVLGGLWNDWQERERNKKANALYGEFARQVQELSGSQNDAGTLTQNGGQGLLNAPEPEEYNSDGWANAFHKAYTPLTQYDFGTGVTPNIAQGLAGTPNGNAWAKALGGANPLAQFDDGVAGLLGQAVPVQTNRIPTAQDTMNILANLLGSKRFGSVDPKAAYEMLTPYLKASEEARQEQRRQEAADAYMNAGNDKDKINQALRYAMQGYIPQETLGSAMDLYKYDNPLLQQYTHNTGATTRYGTFDARRGTFNQAGEFENELTPQQQLDHQFRMLQHDAQQAQQKAQMDYNYASLRQQGELERDRLEQTGQIVQSIHTDANGKTWVVRQNGKREELSEAQGLTEQQKKMLELNGEQLKSIRSRREELEKSRRAWILKGYTENDQPVKEIDEALKGLNADEQKILQDSNDIVKPKNTGQQVQQIGMNETAYVDSRMDIGANMLGVKTPTITTHFNAPRKKKDGTPYGHAGIDYAATKDTPIRLDDVGTTMRVTKVANDPNGYGNYVDLEGTLTDKDGKQHTIGLRFAHMSNGTVNVTKGQELNFGDLIGKVGNTGNSRGKNGGYHLHLETTIDGKRVDPLTFKKLISPYIAYSKTLKPNTFTGTTPAPKVTVMDMDNETSMAYRNPTTGKGITQKEVEDFERKADNGELSYAENKQELHDYWRKNGYVHTGIYNTQNQAQTTSGDITTDSTSENAKFHITEQPTAQQNYKVSPADWRPSYMRGNMPVEASPTLQTTAKVDPFDWRPSYMKEGTPSMALALSPSAPEMPTPSIQEEKAVQEALANLDSQYNTWDDIYRSRYGNISDFWSV